MVEKADKIWFNGKFVNWDDAKVHVLAHGLHYGTSVFEGIRFYKTKKGETHIFKLKEHIKRFFDSAKGLKIKIPFSEEELIKSTEELVEINKLDSGYIRPIAFFDAGVMGMDTRESPVSVSIIAWRWGAYMKEGAENGIKTTICPYRRRISELSKLKIGGNYYLSILSRGYALENGFNESILLDDDGFVAEGPGENIFIVKDDKFITPKEGAILPGITRASVIEIIKEKGYDFEEKDITVDELKDADEVFFTGTAVEITPIIKVDEEKIGDGQMGNKTKKIQELFFERIFNS